MISSQQQTFVFWDIENCKVNLEDDVVVINQNLEETIQNTFPINASNISKYVFLSFDSHRAYKPTKQQLNDLNDLQNTQKSID